MDVAFQGERGAYSEEALHKLLGSDARGVPCHDLEEVFDAVERGTVTAGLVPVENSLVGSIHRTYDLLLERGLTIHGEVLLRIRHHLLALPGTGIGDLREVRSHPVALDQCRAFFKQHSHIQAVPAADTAGSARQVAELRQPEIGAIAGREAIEPYGLVALAEGIEDLTGNYTRFLLLRPDGHLKPEADKISIVFALRDAPGVLFKALSVFALRDIDLTKIESRPLRHRPWRYYFYMDLLGRTDSEQVGNALNHLQEIATFLQVLGCYPRAEGITSDEPLEG